jgi:hypothetical protein
MSTTTTFPKTEKKPIIVADNQKRVDSHKKVAEHLTNASKSHMEAAKHHENGEHEKAAVSTITAHGHHTLARDLQKEDARLHATQA